MFSFILFLLDLAQIKEDKGRLEANMTTSMEIANATVKLPSWFPQTIAFGYD